MELIRFFGKGTGSMILFAFLAVVLVITVIIVNKSSKKEYSGRIIVPAIFIELAVLFGIMALGFPKKGDEVGPAIVPLLWIICILGLSIYLLIRGILGQEEVDPPWGKVSRVIVYIIMIIVYLFFMQLIGYFLATALFLISGMYYLSYRNWKVMISMSVGWILFSYFAFYKLLYVPLPQGLLIERIFG